MNHSCNLSQKSMAPSIQVNQLLCGCAGWIWVACKASRLAFEGILHVLHSASIDAPTSYHICSDTTTHCSTGCLLLCSSAAHAEACVKRIRQWIDDVPHVKQVAVPNVGLLMVVFRKQAQVSLGFVAMSLLFWCLCCMKNPVE